MKDIRNLSKEDFNLFDKEYSFELAYALSLKIKGEIKNVFINEDNKKKEYYKTIFISEDETDCYYDFSGKPNLGYLKNKIKRKLKIDNFYLSFEDVELENLNSRMIEKAKDVLSNFYNKEKEFYIQTKNGEKLKALIIDNADITLGFPMWLTEIQIFNAKEEKVAYLKAKFLKEDHYNFFKKENKKNELPKNLEDLFLNKATVDYIRVSEDYQNKGIGQLMYLNMAYFLNQKNIKFRSSMLRSENAKQTWNCLIGKMHKKEYSKEVVQNDETVFFLSPSKQYLNYRDIKNIKKLKIRKGM